MSELYVLGAGASKASADTPLGSELVWSYYQDCCLMTPILNGRPNNSGENKNFINYIKFLEAAAKYYPEFREEVNKFLNRGIDIYRSPNLLRKKHYVDDFLQRAQEAKDYELIELIRQLIFEHLVESSFNSQNKLYEVFITKILRYNNSKQISIISFNFDFLLHEDFLNEVYFDYLLTFDWIDNNRKNLYKKRNAIPLIKLNGSLDWGICQDCTKLHLYFPHMHRSFYYEQSCRWCKGKVSPFVVIPYQEYGEKIQILWETAKALINRAQKIIVIGYSFPHYDSKAIDLFRNSLTKDTQLEIVDICPKGIPESAALSMIRKKYKKLFPNIQDITIYLSGFNDFLKKRLDVDLT